MSFTNLHWLAAALLAAPVAWLVTYTWRMRVSSAKFYKSTLSARVVANIPAVFHFSAVFLAAVTLCGPGIPVTEKSTTTVQGRDIIMAMDWSASMSAEYKGERTVRKVETWYVDPEANRKPAFQDEGEKDTKVRRIDAAQDAILRFADLRRQADSGDHIGLIVFDYKPLLRWPLDRDLKQISRHGSFLPKGKGPQELGVGTNFGNTVPGPIDMAAEHFEQKGKSTVRVLILLTDGEDEITDKTMKRLSDVVKKAGIRLYVIGIGEKIGKGELTLEKLCRSVGGKVFRAETNGELESCFSQISSLESSPIPVVTDKSFEPVFYWFLTVALLLYVAGLVAEAMILGR